MAGASAIIGGVGALGSAISGHNAAKSQEKAAKKRNKLLKEAMMRAFSAEGPGGISAGFDPATGKATFELGDRLTGQQGLFDTLAGQFAGQVGPAGQIPPELQGILGQLGVAAGNAPGANNSFFSGLQGALGGGLGAAGASLADALGGVSGNLRNIALGGASDALSGIGDGELQRSRTLDLLRQQAAPFEQRAFNDLQDNLFKTGRLGSTGGGIQTEAFARGLGQADLSRQLAASEEGRAYQNNQLGIGSGLAGIGFNEAGLSSNLLNQAFSNFGSMAGLATDVENSRFGQNLSSQQNIFSQLSNIFGNTMNGLSVGNSLNNSSVSNLLSLFGAGNTLNDAPNNIFRNVLGAEAQRSNSILGGAGSQDVSMIGQTQDTIGNAFAGLATAAQGGMFDKLFGGTGGVAKPSTATGYFDNSRVLF